MAEAISHAVIVVALLGAYVAVTLTGHDGNTVLAILGGYGVGSSAKGIATTVGAGKVSGN